MNDELVAMTKEGLRELRQLLAGKHLRPAELALTLVAVHWAPKEAEEILTDHGKRSRWENVDGEA